MIQSKKLKRKARIRKKIFGTKDFPRLTVFKSLQSLSIQVIDDDSSITICGGMVKKNNKQGAKELAEQMIVKLKEKNVTKVKFDRNGYVYHGVIKELADGIRSGSIEF